MNQFAGTSTVHRGAGPSAGRAGHFLAHLIEMCAAMCIGEAILDLLVLGAAWLIGYRDPIAFVTRNPEVAMLVIAFNMALPMVLWMRFWGMASRPTAEMAGSMLVEAIVLIALVRLSLVPASSLIGLFYAFMMPVMVVVMLFRLELYSAGHSAHHASGIRAESSA